MRKSILFFFYSVKISVDPGRFGLIRVDPSRSDPDQAIRVLYLPISCLPMSPRDDPSSMKRFHTVGFILLRLSIFVSMFAMKILAKVIY